MRNLTCLISTCMGLLALAGAITAQTAGPSKDELYRVDSPDVILKAARNLMEADENVALSTVDGNGQPRIRSAKAFLNSVDVNDPKKTMTVWLMTREATRKVDQIRKHSQVTLYFNDDQKVSYLSIMGTAKLYTDPTDPKVKYFLQLEGYKEFFWPDFPKGFVMIEVIPRWIEFMGPGVKNHKENWRPQSVEFPVD